MQTGSLRRTEPVVAMEPTTFRTYGLPVLGVGEAVRIVQSAPWQQRVVILQNAPNVIGAFVATTGGDLNFGGLAPGNAFQLIPRVSLVFVLGVNQHLDAIGAVAGTRVSVSVTARIPDPLTAHRARGTSFFRTYRVPTIGNPIQITPGGRYPRRIVMDIRGGEGSGIFITSLAPELTLTTVPPGGAFELAIAVPLAIPQTADFIVAPRQNLYAASAPGIGAEVLLSVSCADIDIPSLRGPTGIPGPDAQE